MSTEQKDFQEWLERAAKGSGAKIQQSALPPRSISAKKKLEKARLAVDQLERSLQWAVQRLNREDNPTTRQWVRRSEQLLERVRGLEL